MEEAILITQCLQNDFVKPLKRAESLPNLLHIGYSESLRLMGENINEGPIAKVMDWAYEQDKNKLKIIHIRDWHNIADETQKEHFRQFGNHCIKDTFGAEFAFELDKKVTSEIINSNSLNDFLETNLDKILKPYTTEPIKVGLIGVWTEAKITFLAYDLRTRYPNMQLAVCSALTASSSRAHHFNALEQLKSILGVRIFHSIGEFTDFLLHKSNIKLSLPLPSHKDTPELIFENLDNISNTDKDLIRYLFRDCKKVLLKELSGGFSGNLVFSSESIDIEGHRQAPHVVKIGNREAIGHERTSFQKIEEVLGNNAPNITDFADLDSRGALKYRYADMGKGKAKTLQKLYTNNLNLKKIKTYLDSVFKEHLSKLYVSSNFESCNLLEYYLFNSKYAENVKKSIESVLGSPADNKILKLPTGQEFYNPYYFYKEDLDKIISKTTKGAYFSYIHGDLNGANIIIDSHENVWIIDFFHTHRGHILKDLIKLENDLLYIFTNINSLDDLQDGIKLVNFISKVKDLSKKLPSIKDLNLNNPEFNRTYSTLKYLRSFYSDLIKEDTEPLQLFIGLLRYSIHTLTFDEPNKYQKLLALYASGLYANKIINLY